MIPFAETAEGDRGLIELAFSKKKADDRKDWLRDFKVRLVRYRAYFAWVSTSCFAARHLPGS